MSMAHRRISNPSRTSVRDPNGCPGAPLPRSDEKLETKHAKLTRQKDGKPDECPSSEPNQKDASTGCNNRSNQHPSSPFDAFSSLSLLAHAWHGGFPTNTPLP